VDTASILLVGQREAALLWPVRHCLFDFVGALSFMDSETLDLAA